MQKKTQATGKRKKTVFIPPTATDFFEIDSAVEKDARENSWSIESMPGHDASNRPVRYIGSSFAGFLDPGMNIRKYFDFFKDSEGDYWYGIRVMLPSGQLIGMEQYLFGSKTG